MDYEKTLTHFKIKTRHGDRIQAFCPAHDDKNASLSILIADNKMLLFCHAGCLIEDVMKSAGITYNDIFPEKPPPVGVYQYRTEDGHLAYEKVKYKTSDGKTFKQRRIEGDNIVPNLTDVKKIPYNYPNVLKAIKEDALILYVEGEKDAETARLLGYTATTMGGASDWKDEYKNYFKQATIVQIPDKDEPGITLAQRITKSLSEVCKSLKVGVLPIGKDLTEWVEQGNSDLSTIISSSPDLITYKGLSEPIVSQTISGYSFAWNDLNILVKIERLDNDYEGIIIVKEKSSDRVLLTSKINLLAQRTLSELAKRLELTKKLNWNGILSLISNKCFNILQDSGELVDIDLPPATMKIEYLLSPILPEHEPVTIYTSGGKGKSIIADYFAVLIQHGLAYPDGALPFATKGQSNVLYLDWEADQETHKRYITAIKRGLEITDHVGIAYRRLEYPLSHVIDTIRNDVINKNIGLIIIDSQMAATASSHGQNEAQLASEYYNLIRSLHCASLTIDHITKASMSSDGVEAPYGSIVKYNRSRSQFEWRVPEDDDDNDVKQGVLLHRKFNLGKKIPPIGLEMKFNNNGNDELVSIEFNKCDLKDNPSLATNLPQWEQIEGVLLNKSPLTSAEIAEILSNPKIDAKRVNDLLRRKTKVFVEVGNKKWGLLDEQ